MKSYTERVDGYNWTVKVGDRFTYVGTMYHQSAGIALRTMFEVVGFEHDPATAHQVPVLYRVLLVQDGFDRESHRLTMPLLNAHFDRTTKPNPYAKAQPVNQDRVTPVEGKSYRCKAIKFPLDHFRTKREQLLGMNVVCTHIVNENSIKPYYRIESAVTGEGLGDFSYESFNESFEEAAPHRKINVGEVYRCSKNVRVSSNDRFDYTVGNVVQVEGLDLAIGCVRLMNPLTGERTPRVSKNFLDGFFTCIDRIEDVILPEEKTKPKPENPKFNGFMGDYELSKQVTVCDPSSDAFELRRSVGPGANDRNNLSVTVRITPRVDRGRPPEDILDLTTYEHGHGVRSVYVPVKGIIELLKKSGYVAHKLERVPDPLIEAKGRRERR